MIFAIGISSQADSIFYGSLSKDGKSPVKNYLSLTRDQNQPTACDASWAFAPTTAMAIQFNYLLENKFPQVVLSPQMLMNCHSNQLNCSYKTHQPKMLDVLAQLKNMGVSEEGCNNYYANTSKDCSALNKCKDCSPDMSDIHKDGKCTAKDYSNYKLKDFGQITSDKPNPQKQMELYQKILDALKSKGPVVC